MTATRLENMSSSELQQKLLADIQDLYDNEDPEEAFYRAKSALREALEVSKGWDLRNLVRHWGVCKHIPDWDTLRVANNHGIENDSLCLEVACSECSVYGFVYITKVLDESTIDWPAEREDDE